jgi:SWI/SNF-related matrix-associated actin-dependent regulator 1 of chromatin subfamily A
MKMTVKAKENVTFVPETPKKPNKNTISYYFSKIKDKNEVQSVPETPNVRKTLKAKKIAEENDTSKFFKQKTIHVEQSPLQFGKRKSFSKLIESDEDTTTSTNDNNIDNDNNKISPNSLLASDIRQRFEFKPKRPPIASLNDKKHYFKPYNNSSTIPNRQNNPFSNSNFFKTDSTIVKENNHNNLIRKSSIISVESESDSNSSKSNISIFNQNRSSFSSTHNDIFLVKNNKIPRIIDDSDDEAKPKKMEIENKENTRINAYILILTDMFPKKSREEIIEAFNQSKFNLKKAAEILKNDNTNDSSSEKRKTKKRTKKRIVIESDEESMDSYDESDGSDVEYKGNKRRKFSNIISNSSDSEDEDNDTLRFFNNASSQEMQDMISLCSPEQAEIIISNRPYRSITALKRTLNKEKGISGKIIENYEEVINGYNAADSIIESCEKISKELTGLFDTWGVDKKGRLLPGIKETGEGFLRKQPEIINSSMTLKNYQLLGVSWLSYMYLHGFSGILADEMGLGKTAQVISFLGNIYSNHNEKGPFLIIVPSSTKDNWLREFEKWCPELEVRAYYGSQSERYELRHELRNTKNSYNIILTTYQIASNQKEDRAFLKHMNFKIMILDEGHMMKNMTSLRYKHLMTINSDCRFLLTGTPIQNTLQELISLLTFIMPRLFITDEVSLRKIFEVKTGNAAFLSTNRVSKARRIMDPFVLRRKKDEVLKELPNKFEKIIYCEATEYQRKLYDQALEISRSNFNNSNDDNTNTKTNKQINNTLMELRKIADHPLLIRNLYTDEKLRPMSRDITNEEQFCDSEPQYVFEDMQCLSDFELHTYCVNYKYINKYKLKPEDWMNSGKVKKLKEVLAECKARNDKILLFSQFTRMLDILETVLDSLNYNYLRLDGQTPVTERQEIIDNFNNSPDIFIFLLSTKAGGFGINLTSANVVIIYDLDFNPHNDKQAEDRAHRVGQTRDVTVMKFITLGTIEESILNMSTMKLKLDKKISSEDKKEIEPTESSSTNMEIDSNEDSESSDKIEKSLYHIIRSQLTTN